MRVSSVRAMPLGQHQETRFVAGLRKTLAVAAVFGLLSIGAVAPASAASAAFGGGSCLANASNSYGWGKTARTSGSCGVLSVRLQVENIYGGSPYMLDWQHSISGASSITQYVPQSTQLVYSGHGVNSRTTTTWLSV